jgi:short-subunit dehydrogenase
MDEREFAAAFPKFMYLPSRRVAQIGVDALEHDRGDVIAGVQNVISTRVMRALPRSVLLKVLVSQHPALRRDRRSPV